MGTTAAAAGGSTSVRLAAAPPDGPAHRVLRGAVVEALAAPPGPELLTTLIELAGAELPARERTETVRAWRAMTALCDAGRLDAIAALDRPRPPSTTQPPPCRPRRVPAPRRRKGLRSAGHGPRCRLPCRETGPPPRP